MDSDESPGKKSVGVAKGRGRGGRPPGRPRGRGRTKRAVKVIRSDDESEPEASPETAAEEPSPIAAPLTSSSPPPHLHQSRLVVDLDETDISQLEAPTFTTLTRGPPEPMLRLDWSLPVNLIGEKVLNPMIHCCDKCLKPILIYGRLIPCKHVFCLGCGRQEEGRPCRRCGDMVVRVEQTSLGNVFTCTHGGSRYGNDGCRRTYLSQRDLQAHIQHRHLRVANTVASAPPVNSSLTNNNLANNLANNNLANNLANNNINNQDKMASLSSRHSTSGRNANLLAPPLQDTPPGPPPPPPPPPPMLQQQQQPQQQQHPSNSFYSYGYPSSYSSSSSSSSGGGIGGAATNWNVVSSSGYPPNFQQPPPLSHYGAHQQQQQQPSWSSSSNTNPYYR